MNDKLISATHCSMARGQVDVTAQELKPKPTQVPQSIERLASAVGRMTAIVDRLHTALSPILRPEVNPDSPDNPKVAQDLESPLCVTAHEINCQTFRIDELGDILNDLETRVEA